ncbi:hypothetical protein RCL1_001542 [Eukaryota sp. TZLM3-RCL]
MELLEHTISFASPGPALLVPDATGSIHLCSSSKIEGYPGVEAPQHLDHPILIYESLPQFKALMKLVDSDVQLEADFVRSEVLRRSQNIRRIISAELQRASVNQDSLTTLLSSWHWLEIFLLRSQSSKLNQELSNWVKNELPVPHDSLAFLPEHPDFFETIKILTLSTRFQEASLLCQNAGNLSQSELIKDHWISISWILAKRSKIESITSSDYRSWRSDLSGLIEHLQSTDDSILPSNLIDLFITLLFILNCDVNTITTTLSSLKSSRTDWMIVFSVYVLHSPFDVHPFDAKRALEKMIISESSGNLFSPDHTRPELNNFYFAVVELDTYGVMLAQKSLGFSHFFGLYSALFFYLLHPKQFPISLFSHYSLSFASSLLPLAIKSRNVHSLLSLFLIFNKSPFKRLYNNLVLNFSQSPEISDRVASCLSISSKLKKLNPTISDQACQNFGGNFLSRKLYNVACNWYNLGHAPLKVASLCERAGISVPTDATSAPASWKKFKNLDNLGLVETAELAGDLHFQTCLDEEEDPSTLSYRFLLAKHFANQLIC